MSTVHFKITHGGAPYEEPHVGKRIAEQLKTSRWHVQRFTFDQPIDPSYEAVTAGKITTPVALCKLLARAWCVRQVRWSNKQSGILIEVGATGYYLATPKKEK